MESVGVLMHATVKVGTYTAQFSKKRGTVSPRPGQTVRPSQSTRSRATKKSSKKHLYHGSTRSEQRHVWFVSCCLSCSLLRVGGSRHKVHHVCEIYAAIKSTYRSHSLIIVIIISFSLLLKQMVSSCAYLVPYARILACIKRHGIYMHKVRYIMYIRYIRYIKHMYAAGLA